MHIDPVRILRWNMAAFTVGFIVGRGDLGGGLGLKVSPSPAISPKLVVWKPANGVLDHYEPPRGFMCTADSASGHVFGFAGEQFLDQYGAIGKFSGFPIGRNGLRLGINHMKPLRPLFTFISGNSPGSKCHPFFSKINVG